MKAAILAGGKGTRLRPITEKIAKPFVKIAGKPCIEYIIDALVRDGFDDILMTMYYKPGDLIDHFGSGIPWDSNIIYSVEDKPLGTFGGVRKCAGFLDDDTFVVANGDVLADVDIGELYDFHKKRGAAATIALTEVDDPTQFGIVGIDGTGRIERFKEKPSEEEAFSNLINAGIYLLEPKVFNYYPRNRKVDFACDLFPELLRSGEKLYGKKISGFWLDIGRPSDLIQAHLGMFSRKRGDCVLVRSGSLKGVNINGRCFLDDRVCIGRDVTLRDVYIYDGVDIGDGVKIRNSVISSGTRVGDGSTVADSYVCEDARIANDVRLENCVLGEGAEVPPGKVLRDEKIEPSRKM